MNAKERNWGIDLLRVICMISLVVTHLLGHGWITQQINPESWKYAYVIALESLCMFGVTCFAMISGYVGVDARCRYTTLVLQWMKVLLYSALFTLLAAALFPGSVSRNEMLNGFFPTIRRQYWYFTAYAGCFVVSPLVRLAFRSINKRQAAALTAGIVLVFSVLNMMGGSPSEPFYTAEGKNTLWLILMYVIGAWMKTFDVMRRVKTPLLALMTAAAGVLAMMIGGVCQDICRLFTGTDGGYWLFHRFDSPTVVLFSMLMVLLFARLRLEKLGRLLAWLAPLNFSVYLIHDHPLVRRYTISAYTGYLAVLESHWLVLALIGVSVGIYAVCVLLDAPREMLFRKLKLKQRLLALEEKYIGNIWDV